LLFALFLLWLFGRNLDWQEVGSNLRNANAGDLALAYAALARRRAAAKIEPAAPSEVETPILLVND